MLRFVKAFKVRLDDRQDHILDDVDVETFARVQYPLPQTQFQLSLSTLGTRLSKCQLVRNWMPPRNLKCTHRYKLPTTILVTNYWSKITMILQYNKYQHSTYLNISQHLNITKLFTFFTFFIKDLRCLVYFSMMKLFVIFFNSLL